MTKQDLDFLAKLYNNLLLIQTRGEDTIRMADILRELYRFTVDSKQNYEDELVRNKQEREE